MRRRALLAEIAALREMMIAATGRFPKSSSQLFDSVRDEWGEVCERRLWRVILWVGVDGDGSSGYVRGSDVDVYELSRLGWAVRPRQSGEQHWTKRRSDRVPRGESAGGSRLTVDQVLAIRDQLSSRSYRELAIEYGVSVTQIKRISTGIAWAHLSKVAA